MARGGGKGGKGKPTARSRNYLARYGYPSSKALRREAEGLAGASVPSVRSVERPYNRQAQSAKDFLAAVQAALSQTQSQVGSAYDQATSQQGAMDQATQSRLAGLGLGVDAAGVQAAQGARGDSASANLLSNEASAKAYAAAQPGIAAGNTGVVLAGLRKEQTDALQNRRDQLRQSFFAALQNVQSNALARAGFNQSADQFQRNMALQREQMATQASQFASSQAASQASSAASLAEQKREYNLSRKDARVAAAAAGGSASPSSKQPWTAYNMTPTQWRSAQTDAIGEANKAAHQGVPAGQFLDELTRVGNVPVEVALEAMRRTYGTLRSTNPHVHPNLEAAYQSYQHWLSQYYAQTERATPSLKAGRHR